MVSKLTTSPIITTPRSTTCVVRTKTVQVVAVIRIVNNNSSKHQCHKIFATCLKSNRKIHLRIVCQTSFKSLFLFPYLANIRNGWVKTRIQRMKTASVVRLVSTRLMEVEFLCLQPCISTKDPKTKAQD